MLKIAVVENEEKDMENLCGFLRQYCGENNIDLLLDTFQDGIGLASEYRGGYDCIFLDIMMPLLNGMDTAEKIRTFDSSVPIVFTTNLAQYAIRGYKVNAMDFLVKPLQYFDIVYEMEKIRARQKKRAGDDYLWLSYDGQKRKVLFDDILYIDIIAHDICVHLRNESISFRGTLKSVEEKLGDGRFSRCNNCYIVNLQKIRSITDNDVCLENGQTLRISRPRKKEFLQDFAKFIGGGEIR